MRKLWRIHSSDTNVELKNCQSRESIDNDQNFETGTHSLFHELISFCWHGLPRQPTPAGQTPTRRVIQSEIVRISNARNLTEQASATKIVGFDVVHSGYSP